MSVEDAREQFRVSSTATSAPINESKSEVVESWLAHGHLGEAETSPAAGPVDQPAVSYDQVVSKNGVEGVPAGEDGEEGGREENTTESSSAVNVSGGAPASSMLQRPPSPSDGVLNFEQFLHAVESLVLKGGKIASSLVRSRMGTGDDEALRHGRAASRQSLEGSVKVDRVEVKEEVQNNPPRKSPSAVDTRVATGVARARRRPRSAMGYTEARRGKEQDLDLSAWFPESVETDELRAIAREEAYSMILRSEREAHEIHSRKSRGIPATADTTVASRAQAATRQSWESAMDRVYPTGDAGALDGMRRPSHTGRPLSAAEQGERHLNEKRRQWRPASASARESIQTINMMMGRDYSEVV